ncbi:uncharacterized protein LOC136033828 isoform X2 [Artemia franciscana]|uniref:uncharacterized protein LOC136033828 isoform X2 n=1 Tax=Artemia franciscana TaxID=6661 RepID=UPI0032DA09EF
MPSMQNIVVEVNVLVFQANIFSSLLKPRDCMFRTKSLWRALAFNQDRHRLDIKFCQPCKLQRCSITMTGLVLIDFDNNIHLIVPELALESRESQCNWQKLVLLPTISFALESTVTSMTLFQRYGSSILIAVLHPFSVTIIRMEHELIDGKVKFENNTHTLPSITSGLTIFKNDETFNVLISYNTQFVLAIWQDGERTVNWLDCSGSIILQTQVSRKGLILFQRENYSVECYRANSFDRSNSFGLKPVWEIEFTERALEISDMALFHILRFASFIISVGNDGIVRFTIGFDTDDISAATFLIQKRNLVSVVADNRGILNVFQNDTKKWCCKLNGHARIIGLISVAGLVGVIFNIGSDSSINAVILSTYPVLTYAIGEANSNESQNKSPQRIVDVSLSFEQCEPKAFEVHGNLNIKTSFKGELRIALATKSPVRAVPSSFVIQLTEQKIRTQDTYQLPVSFTFSDIQHSISLKNLEVEIFALLCTNGTQSIVENSERLPPESMMKIGQTLNQKGGLVCYAELHPNDGFDGSMFEGLVFPHGGEIIIAPSEQHFKLLSSSHLVVPFVIEFLLQQYDLRLELTNDYLNVTEDFIEKGMKVKEDIKILKIRRYSDDGNTIMDHKFIGGNGMEHFML